MRGETGHLAFESGSGEIIELGQARWGQRERALALVRNGPIRPNLKWSQVDTHWLGLRYCGFFLSADSRRCSVRYSSGV